MEDKIVNLLYKEGTSFVWATWHRRFPFGNRERDYMQQYLAKYFENKRSVSRICHNYLGTGLGEVHQVLISAVIR